MRTQATLFAVGVIVTLAGCPQKSAPVADAAPSASATVSAAPSAAPAPLAANEGDIKRYPGAETKIGVPQKIEAFVATVRSDASSGASLVASLKKGTDTQKIAQKDTFYLITFTDPGSPGRTVMGWVDQKAYTAVIWDASKHFITCPASQSAIVLESGEQCVVQCDPNNDNCPAGQVCNGDAPRSNKGVPGDNIEFCVNGTKKSPTPTPTVTDAAAPPATVDAAAPPATVDAAAPPATVDAGGAVDKRPLTVPMGAGDTCPAGYKKKKPDCRLACPPDCPPNGKCNNGTGMCEAK